ncbi:helix-turn-helix transcriptional regulator [Streptomyces sp. NPDC058664]|uniref:helix-turn-helix transcriptional regulator n=1 Tax=unclassified Streptomyces TaxID=2593676 RepID=UPI003668F19E
MSDTLADSPLMTTKEVARLIRKSPAALRQMRYRGDGPQGFRSGRDTLYFRAEVMRWLAAQMANDRVGQRAAA